MNWMVPWNCSTQVEMFYIGAIVPLENIYRKDYIGNFEEIKELNEQPVQDIIKENLKILYNYKGAEESKIQVSSLSVIARAIR